MRGADRTAGAMLLALALAFSAGALRQYAYWGPNGPGPAFLPFWLGVVMALLALLLLVDALRASDPGTAWLPSGEGLRRLLLVLAASIAYVALLDVIGMVLATVLFLIVLMRFLDRCAWPLTLAVALATAAFIDLVFARWLRVPLPTGMFGFQ
jgi:putative tricarboxylic transport membrane protein